MEVLTGTEDQMERQAYVCVSSGLSALLVLEGKFDMGKTKQADVDR